MFYDSLQFSYLHIFWISKIWIFRFTWYLAKSCGIYLQTTAPGGKSDSDGAWSFPSSDSFKQASSCSMIIGLGQKSWPDSIASLIHNISSYENLIRKFISCGAREQCWSKWRYTYRWALFLSLFQWWKMLVRSCFVSLVSQCSVAVLTQCFYSDNFEFR